MSSAKSSAIYPRKDFDPNRIDKKNKWESVWLYRKGSKILESRRKLSSGLAVTAR